MAKKLTLSKLQKKCELKLVNRGSQTRDCGFDTMQFGVGDLGKSHEPTADYAVKLEMNTCVSVVLILDAFVKKCRANTEYWKIVSTRAQGVRFAYQVRGTAKFLLSSNHHIVGNKQLNPGDDLTYTLIVKNPDTGRDTHMELRVCRDPNGACWLNVRANPTSLLIGYNAFAAAIEGFDLTAERRLVLRMPFIVLRLILMSLDPTFEWSPKTAQRIRELAVRLANMQVFTYALTPICPADYMSFIFSGYNTSFATGKHGRKRIADALRLKVMSYGSLDQMQSLLIRRMAGFVGGDADRQIASVLFYDKLAKAEVDAKSAGADIGSPEDIEFLKTHIRVDINLNQGALKALLREARLKSKDDITVRKFSDAVKILNLGRGKSKMKFIPWLLYWIFDELLVLRALLEFEPAKLDAAAEMLKKYNLDAAAGFAEWRAHHFRFVRPCKGSKDGRPASFSQYLQKYAKKSVSSDVAGTARKKLLAMHLNPDVPLQVYRAFYAQTFHWHMDEAEQAEHTEALARGNKTAAMRLQQKSRANTMRTVNLLRKAYDPMIKDAHVPATTLVPEPAALAVKQTVGAKARVLLIAPPPKFGRAD